MGGSVSKIKVKKIDRKSDGKYKINYWITKLLLFHANNEAKDKIEQFITKHQEMLVRVFKKISNCVNRQKISTHSSWLFWNILTYRTMLALSELVELLIHIRTTRCINNRDISTNIPRLFDILTCIIYDDN